MPTANNPSRINTHEEKSIGEARNESTTSLKHGRSNCAKDKKPKKGKAQGEVHLKGDSLEDVMPTK